MPLPFPALKWMDTNISSFWALAILQIFDSLHDCSRKLFKEGKYIYQISACCRGKRFSYLNHIIRFIDTNDNIIQTNKIQSIYKICSISVYNLEDRLYYNSISDAAKKTGINRVELSASINGSSRFSVVHERIWRKCYSDGTIIENSISINQVVEKYYSFCAINMLTGEKFINKTLVGLAKQVKLDRLTIKKYYELNKPKNNFMFYKIDKQGNLYKKDN